jgi:hypothetical protein
LVNALACVAAVTIGDVEASKGLASAFLTLCLTCGLGAILLLFDPRQLMLINAFSLSRLVEPKRERKSFADRIHVDEPDDEES